MSFPLNPVDNQVYKNYYFDSSANAWLRNSFDPVGTITEYDGTNWIDGVTKPGWFACIPENADKDCPDMTDRFAMGKITCASGSCGGANTITLTTAQIPSHNHGMDHSHCAISCNSTHSHTLDNISLSHGGQSHTHCWLFPISAANRLTGGSNRAASGSYLCACSTATEADFCNHGSHTHTIHDDGSHNHEVVVSDSIKENTDLCDPIKENTDLTGGGQPHENRPSFYSMIYIRKCSDETIEFPLNPVDNQVYKNYYFDSSANAWRRNDFDPVGTITEYDGTNWIDGVTKPGWFACIPENADKDCPDMTDRFAMGKEVFENRVCGGANLVALSVAHIPSHDHGMKHSHCATSCNSTHSHGSSTAATPSAHSVSAHCHCYTRHSSSNGSLCTGSSNSVTSSTTVSTCNAVGLSNHVHCHSVTGGSHNHEVVVCDPIKENTDGTNSIKENTDLTGGGQPHENRPPFYSMIYIRKCF